MNWCENDIKEILYDEEALRKKIKEMGKKISEDYKGKDLILIGVLKGSVIFMADLMKEINIPCNMDFMAVSSYGNSSETSGVVRILKDLDFEIENRDVLIVEDIIDSGITLRYLVDYLKGRKPASIEIVCLLNKQERRKADINVKYIGFDVPDYFIVGYGLDYAEKYRNLPYIAILKEEVYS
ncbi:hypoxanthine phosphoribosyltransferase [Clostridium cochlearium]|jgi:hypoxanthine phosphoribosyltransferase|uniref:Hypoxanthine phosphoribosyltransferase n=1 Tax=Clostridium cochlearium TaxID=1494 RepID=A0A240B2D9_CLOCO|nr:hypoxanthine phosphoribosyltransferase [Clostridium cochlearium]MBV1818996.1 hypoxanthine phosphoribosyltransferase [Bacteroidales bacterium MSK.15.36]NSJ91268.1 hypoxanthine phosphoribosyltransferase [Coprococcus sp. MSK.21.13]MBE6065544.1 hypoxanthine phosphoribosyltransferase [Clostridium cochlearium]MBU5270011.1 hypoxanthine phosphoribosyltransferase [Clostridium cochlearium]MCG4572631.1 hypoxanthine phosphoribosyltransferase [Clostridium cochlearium]